MSRRSHILRIMFCLTLGAAASVLSAWICQIGAWGAEQDTRRTMIYGRDDFARIIDEARPIDPPDGWPTLSPDYLPTSPEAVELERALAAGAVAFTQRRASAFGVRAVDTTSMRMTASLSPSWTTRIVTAGWPVRGCRSIVFYGNHLRAATRHVTYAPAPHGGIVASVIGLGPIVPERATLAPSGVWQLNAAGGGLGGIAGAPAAPSPADFVRLAIAPIWPAFAINTAFYGGLAYFTLFGFAALKRRRRRRRGLCVRCAYSLGTLNICPECGLPAKS